ncbi:MAG: hypothetical protein A3C79_01300 [Candidatus Taylorbacteria bacterium RIFCSPHIGHO2_02_FULL_45_28]|nr:MAG: hypothetical protein A3C79_01300 [Candidatus Taylorbacteria bacterium RIFCSPHIGHO2_02_FULL_45_28]
MKNKTILLIQTGLAAVFLANALTAIFNPGEFTEIIENSFIGAVIPTGIALVIIAVNDGLMTLLILFSKKWRPPIFGWAVIWIAVVLIAIGEPLDILEESGFLFMALALFFDARNYKLTN